MHATLVVLALVVCSAVAQNFKCDLEYRSALMRNGFVKGTLTMSLTPAPRMLVSLPAQGTREAFTELVQMNQFGGFNGASALPYVDQIVFRKGTSCACETGYFDYSQPLLYPFNQNQQDLLDAFYTKGAAQVDGCDVYTVRVGGADKSKAVTTQNSLDKIKVPMSEIRINPASKLPCGCTWNDGRKYTFKNCQAIQMTGQERQATFQEPTGCKCGKPIDIALVLDRSGSISVLEFNDQKGFVQDFVKQFDYDPLKANLAIVNFQAKAWLHLALTNGISRANVDTAVNALGCPKSCDQANGANCDGNVNNCCCCCGTCISCGMRMGGDQLALGRSFAFKLLITITDGYANHLFDSTPCGNDLVKCNNDLQAAANYVYTKSGGKDKVALYAVGVGSDRDVSIDQLIIAAGNLKDHVLRRNNFAELATVNVELIARSCDENQNPCGACCGFCACGKCQPPDACDATSPCVNNSVPTGQVCCAPVPVSCAAAAAADKCSTFVCDNNPASAKAGTCIVNSSVTCTPAQNPACFDRQCVKATGLCATTKKSTCTGVTECQIGNVSSCDDQNVCTVEDCTADGACVWTNVDCKKTLPPNQCYETICDKVTGCGHKALPADLCNDNNVCTEDKCDNTTGCVRTNITCDDKNPCTNDICDPINGCRYVPKVCSTNISCNIAFCNATDGRCGLRVVPCKSEFPVVPVVAGVGAAAIVGIVIAAVIAAAACAGGGAYAVVQAQKSEAMAGAANNPLYKASGNQGVNPLYKA